MNYALIFKLLGNILRFEAIFMLFPLGVAVFTREGDWLAFLWSILVLAVVGSLLSLSKPKNKKFSMRDAFAAAALSWIAVSVFGSLPFIFSGSFETISDCIFEAVSGFTTTGATILTDIESLPTGILFWRNFSHWIGGMGVLLFMLAVMPSSNASQVNLFRVESTGPSPGRMVPKLRETVFILYLIYFLMTVLLFVLLMLTGLPVFDALMHAFSIAGTGGFSNRNASAGAYNNVPAEIIMTVFMILFGVSYSLYYCLYRKNFKAFFKDEELRFYIAIVLAAMLIITIDITGFYDSVSEALRHSSFQVSTIITTTGFSTTDFNLWPSLSRIVLVLLMLTGCCAGSTGGGVKLIRVLILLKAVKAEVHAMLHPKSVRTITVNGRKIEDEVVKRVLVYFAIYIAAFFLVAMLISLEGRDMLTTVMSSIAMLSNVGPGLGSVGPTGSYGDFSQLSKLLFSLCMIVGRLEFFPVIVLLRPSIWRGKQ